MDSTRPRPHGDPDAAHVLAPVDRRRQRDAEAVKEWVGRQMVQNPPPRLTEEKRRELATLLAQRTPDHELVNWRLRLFCGHIVERTAHRSYADVHQAFGSHSSCPHCGLDPATIVAARPLG